MGQKTKICSRSSDKLNNSDCQTKFMTKSTAIYLEALKPGADLGEGGWAGGGEPFSSPSVI